jgi:hypothetical protein
MRMRGKSLGAMAWVAALGAACAVQAPRPPQGQEQGPAGFPEDFYQQSAQRGLPVFEIDPAVSLIVIEVRRGGSLARLGHDHAIASHDVRGYVAPSEARADLFVRLDELVVDEPELRAQAAFDSQPTAAAIAGTRENMLAQLHADLHPYAVIAVDGMDAVADGPSLNASIAVNGVKHAVRIPVHIDRDAGQLTVSGRVALEQSQFGIEPLAILGGAIVVQDRVEVRFEIHAHLVPS